MKNTRKAFVFSFVFILFGILTPALDASAALEYTFLEKIPLAGNLNGSDLPGYLNAVYKVALIIVTLSAVFMLSVGGFMYLTSAGNTASISTAKGIITDSLIGLVIALTAWLLLYIINPDLVETTLVGVPAPSSPNAPPASPGGVGNLPPQESIALATQILANTNIQLATGGDCSSPSGVVSPQKNMQSIAAGKKAAACSPKCNAPGVGSSGCMDDKTTLSNTMLEAIWTVGQTKTFTINSISGGPHSSSSQHYVGRAIDISPITQTLLDAFVQAGAITPSAPPTNAACQVAGFQACGAGRSTSMCEFKGQNVGCNPPASHIHIVFPG